MQRLVLLTLAACLALGIASAEDVPHVLTNLPPSGEVTTGFFFPTYPNKKFPAGKLVDIAIGMHNDGTETYNISLITGSLNSPTDFSLHVQNFTQMGYGHILEPGQEVSLEYKFMPDHRLEPRDFTVALTAFYSDSKGRWHSTTFFNQTINIVEVKKMVDWELLFLIALFVAAIAAAAYSAYSYVVSLGWLKSQKKRQRARRTPGEAPPAMTAEDHADWVKGTPYDAFQKRAAKAKAGRSASTTADKK
ncbi:translocon-associated protein alpha subunit [Haematococcus lacustris]